MMWVLIFGGIALAGVIMLVCYAVWLAHKASDLMSEFTMLGTRAQELQTLMSQLDLAQLEASHNDSATVSSPARVSVDTDSSGALTAQG